MSYYTAVPTKSTKKYGELYRESSDGLVQIYKSQGTLTLYVRDYEVAELISGEVGFQKRYNSDPNIWLEEVRKKDLKKVENLIEQTEQILKDVRTIETIWSNL